MIGSVTRAMCGLLVFVLVGAAAFVAGRLTSPPRAAPSALPIEIPKMESLVRYENLLDRVRASPERVPVEVETLHEAMRAYDVPRIDERLDQIRTLLGQVSTLDPGRYDERRRPLAVELRQRVGVLRALRDRGASASPQRAVADP